MATDGKAGSKMARKAHYLAGVVHTGSLDGAPVLTTWTTLRSEATRAAEGFRSQGAVLARIFTDGRSGFRVVGFWPGCFPRAEG